MSPVVTAGLVVLALVLIVLLRGLKVVKEYERGVVFRLGRCVGARGPGLFYIVPLAEKFVKVSLQTNAVQIPVQQVITSDSVSLKVDAYAYMKVVDPERAVVQVANWYQAAQSVAQTSLQTVIGHHALDELLTARDRILAQAARAIAAVPGAMHLRTLQTLSEISTERNSTILFPIELIEALGGNRRQSGSERVPAAPLALNTEAHAP